MYSWSEAAALMVASVRLVFRLNRPRKKKRIKSFAWSISNNISHDKHVCIISFDMKIIIFLFPLYNIISIIYVGYFGIFYNSCIGKYNTYNTYILLRMASLHTRSIIKSQTKTKIHLHLKFFYSSPHRLV